MSLLRPRSPYLYVLPSFLSCEEHIACCQFRAAINRIASKCEFDLRVVNSRLLNVLKDKDLLH